MYYALLACYLIPNEQTRYESSALTLSMEFCFFVFSCTPVLFSELHIYMGDEFIFSSENETTNLRGLETKAAK